MRILSINYPLPNANIDNKDIFNAPSIFEYKAIVLDPRAIENSVLKLINNEEDFYTDTGQKVTLEETKNNQINLLALLDRRAMEFKNALDSGSCIIIRTYPENLITKEKVVKNVNNLNILNKIFNKIINIFKSSRYFFLNNILEDTFDINKLLIQGSGVSYSKTEDYTFIDDSYFSSLLRNELGRISYNAYLNTSYNKNSNIKPILSTVAGSVIAFKVDVLQGSLFFLPNFKEGSIEEVMREANALTKEFEYFFNK
jgi:hypothetical protein